VCWCHFLAADFLVAATGAAVGAVMVGPAAGPLEQPTSANNTNISPTASASARTGALLLILITIVRIIGFIMLDPYGYASPCWCGVRANPRAIHPMTSPGNSKMSGGRETMPIIAST
jgi:hypothetical protein